MKCTICKSGEMGDGKVTVTLQRDSGILVIRNVPASVCENCGEYAVSESVAEELIDTAEKAVADNAEIQVSQYAA